MFDWLNIAALLGGTGLIGFVLLAVFAPSVISVAAEWLRAASPLVRGIADGIVAFVTTLWEGFKDMVDNAASIVFVATVIVLTAWYFNEPAQQDCKVYHEKKLEQFRKDYKFVPRSSKEKRAYRPASDSEPIYEWSLWPFK